MIAHLILHCLLPLRCVVPFHLGVFLSLANYSTGALTIDTHSVTTLWSSEPLNNVSNVFSLRNVLLLYTYIGEEIRNYAVVVRAGKYCYRRVIVFRLSRVVNQLFALMLSCRLRVFTRNTFIRGLKMFYPSSSRCFVRCKWIKTDS
ncbi:hypothetical protein KC19_VG027500 [Ceratodon purpureus]|uniref:Secreted protein n=1 Tax=Ceratodon purpureus TaxID=3225 RepID=A0A8T0HLB9_CERPU|nr:hypothetical protein KC19_VG027500 [Ceratodon purpureus]